MNRIFSGISLSSLMLLSACGGSTSGNSNGKGQCTTPPAANPLKMIRIPGSNPQTPGNTNTPAVPTPPDLDNLPTTTQPDNCDTTKPGNLGSTPTTGTPVANGPGMNPGTPGGTFPGGNTPNVGGNGLPATDVTSMLGDWMFEAAYCDNGSVTPALQRLNEMRRNDEFYVTLSISRSGMEEYRWIKVEDPTSRLSMMCTLKQTATYTSAGPSLFKVSVGAASYEDAGGETPCNLGSMPAKVFEKVAIVVGGDAMVRAFPNAPECNGLTMLQTFQKRP